MKLLTGLASLHPDPRFLKALPSLLRQLDSLGEHELYKVTGKNCEGAINEYFNYAVDKGFDYVMSLEDDHWGFQDGMVEALIRGIDDEHLVCAMQYHSRHYPWMLTMMKALPERPGKYQELRQDSGYADIDMCGFGMTLFDCRLFEKLERPYVTGNPTTGAIDDVFIPHLRSLGIGVRGCFEHYLNHRDVTKQTIYRIREQGIVRHNRARLFKKKPVMSQY